MRIWILIPFLLLLRLLNYIHIWFNYWIIKAKKKKQTKIEKRWGPLMSNRLDCIFLFDEPLPISIPQILYHACKQRWHGAKLCVWIRFLNDGVIFTCGKQARPRSLNFYKIFYNYWNDKLSKVYCKVYYKVMLLKKTQMRTYKTCQLNYYENYCVCGITLWKNIFMWFHCMQHKYKIPTCILDLWSITSTLFLFSHMSLNLTFIGKHFYGEGRGGN